MEYVSADVAPALERTTGYLRRGTPAFRRANLSLFLAGLVTFAILYCTQPLLPIFSSTFHLTPAWASVSLSASTATLAITLIVAGSLSEVWGRTSIMTASVVLSSVLEIATAFSPNFAVLIALRALQGVTLAGLPASAMAYLAEEIDPGSFGFTMGLYIGGNAVGGLLGRVVTGLLTAAFSWRVAIGGIGVLSIVASLVFWRNLPPSRHFHPHPRAARTLIRSLGTHLTDRGLPWLFVLGALLLGSIVAVYNYIGYRLLAAPYHLSPAIVGGIYAVYVVGIFSSAWMGRLADRFTRRKLLWINVVLMLVGITLTLAEPLPLVVLGVAVLTFGFFAAHSIASSWVGKRAKRARAQASALYLLCYYIGSSVGGTAGGIAYARDRWSGVVLMIAGMVGVALLISARLSVLAPIPEITQPSHPTPV
ncbi:MAG: MFS transporter [Chloroflexota bacterium]